MTKYDHLKFKIINLQYISSIKVDWISVVFQTKICQVWNLKSSSLEEIYHYCSYLEHKLIEVRENWLANFVEIPKKRTWNNYTSL